MSELPNLIGAEVADFMNEINADTKPRVEEALKNLATIAQQVIMNPERANELKQDAEQIYNTLESLCVITRANAAWHFRQAAARAVNTLINTALAAI